MCDPIRRAKHFKLALVGVALAHANVSLPSSAAEPPSNWATDTATVHLSEAVPASAKADSTAVSQEGPQPSAPDNAAPDSQPLEVVVTGSRIHTTDTTSPAPVTVVGASTVEDRGFTQVGEALNELPSITPSFPRNTGIGYAIVPQDAPNLFDLGAGRTLSLVNGRRMVTTSPGLDDPSVDTNVIPVGLLDHIDVVEAGGAAVYGSGAIAGVVNYVLKKNFQGAVIDSQYGISTYGDYPTWNERGTFGTNFNDGRGNIALDVEYSRSGSLSYTARAQSALVPYPGTNPANKTNSDGIPSTVYFTNTSTWTSSYNGLFWGDTGTGVSSLLKVNGSPVQFNTAGTSLVPYNPGNVVFSNLAQGGDGVPYNSKSSLYPAIERYVANVIGHYDITDNVTVSTELLFADVRSDDPLARLRTVQYDNTGSAAGGTFSFAIYKDNAYLTPAEVAELSAASPAFAAGGPLYLGKFADNLLYNTDVTTDTKTYRALVALDGNFNAIKRKFDWSFSFSDARVNTEYQGWNVDQPRLRNAADAVLNSAGQIVCRINQVAVTDPNCVPIDLFGRNNISAAARAYVDVQSGRNQYDVYTPFTNTQADLLASLGGDLVHVPAGQAKFNVTYEHRNESAETTPLEADELGLVGAQTPLPAVSGSYDTNEIAAELLLPVLGPDFTIPLVKRLELNGSYRLVDNSLAGHEAVWGSGLRWEAPGGFTFRSSLSRNFRAPTLDELLAPSTVSAAGATNPCSNVSIVSGSNPAARYANCLALFEGNPAFGATATNPAGSSAAARLAGFYDYANAFNRVLVTTGGNPDLQNEISHTLTYGMIYQPDYIRGLSISVDRIQLDLREALSSFTATSFLATCFDSTVQPAGICSTFTYNPDGTLATARSTTFNAGYLSYRGETYNASYRFEVASLMSHGKGDLGFLTVVFDATHNALLETSVTGLDLTRLDGTTQMPSWVFHPQIHYEIGKFQANYSLIYLPAEPINYTDNVENASVLPVAGNLRQNIEFAYEIGPVQLRFGINNFTNQAPSFPYSAGYGDIIGRDFFLAVKAKL